MHAHLYIQYMHTSQFPLYAHTYIRVYVYEYFHMAVYICSCLPLFSFLSLLLQSLLLHNILELEPSWAELWVAWLLAWFALALGCATRLSQRDMQTQANKVHTHIHTHTDKTQASKTHMQLTLPPQLQRTFSTSLSFSLRLVDVRLNDDDDGSEVDDSSSDCDGRLCLYHFLPCLALKARQASREQRSNPSGRRQKSSKQQQKSV